MWTQMGQGGSFNWSTAFTSGQGCHAGNARRQSSGFSWQAGARITVRLASAKNSIYSFRDKGNLIATRIQKDWALLGTQAIENKHI
jgi:hypothetical protein